MRKIKFRVWDKNQKRWVFFELFPNASTTPAIYRGSDFEDWQEFTGLLDKNGKEIYEGDLLKNEGEAIWIKQLAAFRVNPSRKNHDISFTESFANIDNLEIIGNVYENSELLQ